VFVCRSLAELPPTARGGAVTIGNFDGVHRGHAALIARLQAAAKKVGGPAIVFTFDPHPRALLRPDEPIVPLMWPERKWQLLEELGVDGIVVYPTDQALLSLSAADFFQNLLVENLAPKAIVEGANFFFGRKREGNVQLLEQFCRNAKIELEILQPVTADGGEVSSSQVRSMLLTGDVAAANSLLTKPYRLRGEVVTGARRGATLGFPTANIEQPENLLPGTGVYAGRAFTSQRDFPAAIHIGPNPTFGEEARKLEAHLIGFSGDLYGQVLEVEFDRRLRDVRKFNSREELVEQLRTDITAASA
jgi:riboflavin kinase/FMN adenylyltransferase